jgi:hypothetical protein
MIDLTAFNNLRLWGGFVVAAIELTREPMVDALGREAVAQTRVVGTRLHLSIRAGLSDQELSITLYHEILEAASVASVHPPESVMDLNEAGFERAARTLHDELGEATPKRLNRMLQSYGFREQ